MLVNSWEQIPFAIGVNNLTEDKSSSELPFSISCGTQQGIEHFENSFGNQDAISIVIEDNLIVGVICDGCTSSNINSVNDYTSNQVGANLLSKKTSSVICTLVKKSGVKSLPENLLYVQNSLLNFLKSIIDILADNEVEKQLLINNFFTTTIIAFAIDKEDYCIFNFGDGMTFLNTEKKELKFTSGKYLTSYLENNKLSQNGFEIIEAGKSDQIQSIFISSDGFDNDKILSNEFFLHFLNKKSTVEKKGFIDGLPEFRKIFLTPFIEKKEIFNQWPNDDATYILVKRIKEEIIETNDNINGNSFDVKQSDSQNQQTNTLGYNPVSNTESAPKDISEIQEKNSNIQTRIPKKSRKNSNGNRRNKKKGYETKIGSKFGDKKNKNNLK